MIDRDQERKAAELKLREALVELERDAAALGNIPMQDAETLALARHMSV